MLCTDAEDGEGSYTEHKCYDCWATEEGNPTSEGSLQAQQGTNKWRYISLWDPSLCDNNAWEFLVGAYVGALGKLEEQRAISLEGYRAKRPWNRNCDEEQILLWLTRMTALNPVESMTAWSFEALMEIKPKFTECPRHSQEEARFERWTSVWLRQALWVQAGTKRAATMAHVHRLSLYAQGRFRVVLGEKQQSQAYWA